MATTEPAQKARQARLGLATRAGLDRTTHAMLLRQLYMALYETRRFRKAFEIAEQATELRVMTDVAHQDAARAAVALGLIEEAVGHLRLAARRGPPTRRAFHLWTLGSVLYVVGRHAEAAGYLKRAIRWGTNDRPLYVAHAALARLAAGERVRGLAAIYDDLEAVPAGQGYGRFVLGQLAFHLERRDDAKRLLQAFLRRTTEGRPALALSLAGELRIARATLARLVAPN